MSLPKARGLNRDADNDRCISVHFTRRLTDDEFRHLHEALAGRVPIDVERDRMHQWRPANETIPWSHCAACLIQQGRDVLDLPCTGHGRISQRAREVNNDEVICPGCSHQFRAVPVNVQSELAQRRAALKELVACKVLKDRIEWLKAQSHERLLTDSEVREKLYLPEEYARRKPLAWDVAFALEPADQREREFFATAPNPPDAPARDLIQPERRSCVRLSDQCPVCAKPKGHDPICPYYRAPTPITVQHLRLLAPYAGIYKADFENAATTLEATEAHVSRLDTLINTPELNNFLEGVRLEAAHQVERWGTAHDRAKRPADWLWLVGYLAGKALHAQLSGDIDKARHHTISTAAALKNWHAAISGTDNRMAPGSSDIALAVERNFPGEAA